MPNQHPADQLTASSPRMAWAFPNGMVHLSFANYILKVLTLGIYHFWAKTEIRKRIWSGIRFDAEPLVYTGTGRELFLGFLVVFFIILLPISLGALVVLYLFGHVGLTVYQVCLFVGLLYLIGVAIYRATRYRLSRTLWRGIRGSLIGSSWGYGWTYFWTLLLPFVLVVLSIALMSGGVGATAGDPETMQTLAPILGFITLFIMLSATWIVPWRSTKLQRHLVNDMHFGNRPFSFNAPLGPLYKRYAVFWFGCVVLLFALIGVGASTIDFTPLAGAGEQEDPQMTPEQLKAMGALYLLLGVGFFLYYLLSMFYYAFQFNHFAAHTHYEGATFFGTATGRGLVWIAIGNFFIWLGGVIVGLMICGLILGLVALTSGIPPLDLAGQAMMIISFVLLAAAVSLFHPIIAARTIGYLARNIAINGTIDVAAIQQGADQHIRMGEGLVEAFDIDAI